MGSRAFGELLLRPSTFTRIAPASRFTPVWTAQRCISNTAPQSAASPARQQRPETATTPEVAASSPTPEVTSSPTPAPRKAANQAIDDLFGVPSSGAAPNDMTPQNRLFGAEFSTPGRRGRRGPPKLAFGDMAMTPDELANPTLANKPSTPLAEQQKVTFENYPRLNPEYGRTVHLDVSRGRDIVRGIGMLGSLMARNKVKADFNKQRFHERGGLKRKRLNSQRWRARFKAGFQNVTGRVVELTRKGW